MLYKLCNLIKLNGIQFLVFFSEKKIKLKSVSQYEECDCLKLAVQIDNERGNLVYLVITSQLLVPTAKPLL